MDQENILPKNDALFPSGPKLSDDHSEVSRLDDDVNGEPLIKLEVESTEHECRQDPLAIHSYDTKEDPDQKFGMFVSENNIDAVAADPLSDCNPLSIKNEVLEDDFWISDSIKHDPEVHLDSADSNVPCVTSRRSSRRRCPRFSLDELLECLYDDAPKYKCRRKMHYLCDQCGKTFTSSAYWKRHKMLHMGEKPYRCDACGKAFSCLKYLKQHKIKHMEEKRYHCDTCGKKYSHYNSFKLHQRMHTGEKPYHCIVCGKEFRSSSNLKAHKLVHTGEKPYRCKTCGKRFSGLSGLNNHKRLHSREKPYHCDVCGKEFSCPNNLKEHKRLHTGERYYHCDVCGKSFRSRSNLKHHVRIHME